MNLAWLPYSAPPVVGGAFNHPPVFCADIPPLRELGNEEIVYFSLDADPVQAAALVVQSLPTISAFRLAARIRQNFAWEQIC
jgi:hypothetical protein